MKLLIMHDQDLAALYAKWARLFKNVNDNQSAKWAQTLSADYATSARFRLIKLISKGESQEYGY